MYYNLLCLGAGIFVTTVVAGAITVTKPFHTMERPFLRDVIFYMVAVFFTFCILYDEIITLAEASGSLDCFIFLSTFNDVSILFIFRISKLLMQQIQGYRKNILLVCLLNVNIIKTIMCID